VQITIDSTEPLDKVLALIGALYGVSVQTALDDAAPTTGRSRTTPRSSRRGDTTRPRTRKASAATKSSRRSKATPNAASVRSWARANGHPVGDRGRVPAAVTEAYLAAGAPSD